MLRAISIPVAAAMLGALSPYLDLALHFAGFGDSDVLFWWFGGLMTPALTLIDPPGPWTMPLMILAYALQWLGLLYAVRWTVRVFTPTASARP